MTTSINKFAEASRLEASWPKQSYAQWNRAPFRVAGAKHIK